MTAIFYQVLYWNIIMCVMWSDWIGFSGFLLFLSIKNIGFQLFPVNFSNLWKGFSRLNVLFIAIQVLRWFRCDHRPQCGECEKYNGKYLESEPVSRYKSEIDGKQDHSGAESDLQYGGDQDLLICRYKLQKIDIGDVYFAGGCKTEEEEQSHW